MKGTILLAIFMSLGSFSYAQDDSSVISNTLTDKHVNINGTKVSIIPPDGFEKGGNLMGFRHVGNGSLIMVITVDGPVASALELCTERHFTAGRVEVKIKEDLLFNGHRARFFKVELLEDENVF